MNKLVILDAGHGINTPGKRSPLYPLHSSPRLPVLEWQLNIAIVTAMYKILTSKKIAVEFSSTNVLDQPLQDRIIKIKNLVKQNAGANIVVVSVHCNAYNTDAEFSSPNGIEFLYSTKIVQNERLARHISAGFDGTYLGNNKAYKNRGLRERSGLYLLNASPVPTVLVEAGFMTSFAELQQLLDYHYQVYIANTIIEGVLSYYDSLQ